MPRPSRSGRRGPGPRRGSCSRASARRRATCRPRAVEWRTNPSTWTRPQPSGAALDPEQDHRRHDHRGEDQADRPPAALVLHEPRERGAAGGQIVNEDEHHRDHDAGDDRDADRPGTSSGRNVPTSAIAKIHAFGSATENHAPSQTLSGRATRRPGRSRRSPRPARPRRAGTRTHQLQRDGRRRDRLEERADPDRDSDDQRADAERRPDDLRHGSRNPNEIPEAQAALFGPGENEPTNANATSAATSFTTGGRPSSMPSRSSKAAWRWRSCTFFASWNDRRSGCTRSPRSRDPRGLPRSLRRSRLPAHTRHLDGLHGRRGIDRVRPPGVDTAASRDRRSRSSRRTSCTTDAPREATGAASACLYVGTEIPVST